METIDTLIRQIRRLPGITLDPMVVEKFAQQTDFTVAELHKYLAKASDTDLEYNRQGSPRFMPKNAIEVNAIRELWDRCGLDSKGYGPGGKR